MRVPTLEAHTCFRRGKPVPVITRQVPPTRIMVDDEVLVSNKSLANRDKLHDQLRKGENIFAHITGDLEANKEQRKARIAQAKADARRQEAEATKKALTHRFVGSSKVNPRIRLDPDFARQIGFTSKATPQVEDPPGTVRCSYCKKEILPICNATYGRSRGRVRVREEVIQQSDGSLRIEEKVTFTQEKLVACPDCVLHIKPILDKDGEIAQQGVIIPNTD